MSEQYPFPDRRRSSQLKDLSEARALIVSAEEAHSLQLRHALYGIGVKRVELSNSFERALTAIRTLSFDLAFVDRESQECDGLFLGPIIRRIHPQCASFLLVKQSLWATVEAAHELGFTHIIERGSDETEISHLIQEAVASPLPESRNSAQEEVGKVSLLTHREREILIDLSTGKQSQEIARLRHISESTIKSHLSSIYRKLGVRNRVEAIAQIRS